MSHKYENRTRRIEIKKSLIPSTRKYGSSQENDIVTFRPTYLEPRFVRPSFIVVFKTPLPRYRTQRRKDFLFVLSGREGRMQSNPRIDHLYIIHRKSCTETKFTSGGDFATFFYPWPSLRSLSWNYTNERRRGMENEVIEGQPIFECRAFFNLHNVSSFRDIPLDVSRVLPFLCMCVCMQFL